MVTVRFAWLCFVASCCLHRHMYRVADIVALQDYCTNVHSLESAYCVAVFMASSAHFNHHLISFETSRQRTAVDSLNFR